MASKIRLLDDITINKIAAGEVIENPSSVVKELIENSLDAGATQITVEVSGGGRALLRVSDNGSGMGKDDALLCLERHATSKLKSIDDLSTLHTLGFRGEAIPSIASISKFTLHTFDGQESSLIKVQGGKFLSHDQAERTKGTTIEVKDLFYNVPVRKKFQRSPAYDEQEISRIISLEAIAHPKVQFQLIINQKTEILVHPEDLSGRVCHILGHEFYQELIPLHKEGLTGWISEPKFHKATRQNQYLFINQRPVTSSFISYAVKEAFSTYLPHNRFPSFVLFLNCLQEEIDVNVHPQKKEVRLRQESDLKRLIFLAVQESLASRNTPKSLNFAIEPSRDLPWDTFIPEPAKEFSPPSLPLNLPPLKPAPSILTTLKGYIVAEGLNGEGLTLIDQTRAHARCLFEQMEKKSSCRWEKEQLLIPHLIELSSTESERLKTKIDEFKALGIELREFAPRTFAIDAYATYFKEEDLKDFILSYLTDEEMRLPNKAAEKASEKCISHTKLLTIHEAERLVSDLLDCTHPYESPLGKPTIIHLNREAVAKQFLK